MSSYLQMICKNNFVFDEKSPQNAISYQAAYLKIRNERKKATVYWYSTEMLVVEKIRAICQQHPNYPHRRKTTNRARDFYDIANLIEKKIKNQELSNFKNKCAKLIDPIFEAKQVDKKIMKKIFEPEFITTMKEGWLLVLETIPNRKKREFEIYVDILEEFINSISELRGR